MNANKSVTANFTQTTATMPTDTVYQNTTDTVFSSTTDYQQIATTGWSLSGTTITLWANPSNLTGSHYLFGHTIAGGWSNRVQLYLTDSALGLGLGDTHVRQSNLATLSTGQWTFVSLSWNGTNYTVQVNGQTAGTGAYTGLTALETFADIGNNGSAASRTEGFAGTIDDVRIYGRALSNTEVTAIYNNGRTTAAPTTYTLTTTAASGVITKKVGGVTTTATSFASGAVVELTATANAGYTFASWTGGATGTTNPVTITMDANKSVTANFTANTYTLTTTTTNGTVTKSPSKTSYTYGEVVTLTATANAGYAFGSWTGDATGTTNPVTVTMNANKSVTANFTQLTLANGLTAHWLLDENTGIAAMDCTAAQLSANLVGTPSWGFGWADEDWVALNSTTQALAIPATTVTPQAGSIVIWLEPQDLAGTKFILGHVYNSANRLSLYTVAGKLAVGLGSNAALLADIATLTTGQPVHIALTWNGTAYAVFVNSQQKAAGTFSGITALNSTIDIGNYGDPASRTLGIIGNLDDVRTYSRALSAAEVASLYQTYDAKQHKTVEFTLSATTAQGVPIVYTAASLPTGAQFNAATQTLTWQPWYNQSGNHTLRFTAAGQPDRIVTVSVHTITLANWYKNFLIQQGKLAQ
jgi:uncharacterized repeat protein (TIGR02543 family)